MDLLISSHLDLSGIFTKKKSATFTLELMGAQL